MQKCQLILNHGVAAGDIPFAVAMTASANRVQWSGAAGNASLAGAATENTIFRIYSMTKAIASTAAIMLVDRGKLQLDTPVETVLPEFGRIKVLEGFDGTTPRLRAPRTRCTIRHLLTHTSGSVYHVINPDVLKYPRLQERPTL